MLRCDEAGFGSQKIARNKKTLPLYEDVGHLLRRAQQTATRQYRAVLSSARLSPIQYGVLRGLEERGPSIQRHLSAHVGIDPANLHDMLKRLEQKGLVKVGLNPDTRRQELISLSAKAERLLEDLLPRTAEISRELVAQLDADEREHVIGILQKFAGIRTQA